MMRGIKYYNKIEMRNNSYRTFSYNVSIVYLNTYDPVCPIGIQHCYVVSWGLMMI